MGVLLRLAVTAAVVYGLVLGERFTESAPKKDNVVWLNDLVNQYVVPQSMVDAVGGMSHVFRTYVRNVLAGTLVYHITAGLWSLYIYVFRGKHFFPTADFPTREIIVEQICHAQVAVFSYAVLPLIAAFVSERGYNLTYFYVSEVGWPSYILCTLVYLAFIEMGVYWMHRKLHTNKFLYRHVHLMHHKYNKANEMSPYASIAFHPLDGILQALPYVALQFVIPTHYVTSLIMFAFTAVWATAIHDGVPAKTEPIMGAAYHTDHHVYYSCNYGQFFTFCDAFWGTLRLPGKRKRAA